MTTSAGCFQEFREKMEQAGLSKSAILSFKSNYESLCRGETGMIPESTIEPIKDLPGFEVVRERAPEPELLSKTVVLKLNGGLGTGMGLERAKSLLEIKQGKNFLDFIAEQILFLRKKHGSGLKFLVMNSFSTSRDTLDHLSRFKELGEPKDLELMQNFVPKLDAKTLRPVSHPSNPQLEWCPPGHGDLYPSLHGSGRLDEFLQQGFRYLFVSNSDNLGASVDIPLLTYFARSNQSFLMEVCERTPADKKGGHLARKGDRLLLRESAQCQNSDQEQFQDIKRHHYFNTNNLWIRLDLLKTILNESGGFIPLPMIKNSKTVDPRDKNTKPVYQLESAMGAAIESFPNAGAIIVPRSRFAPVKTTSDLLALRSDAYRVTEDHRLELAPQRHNNPPSINLDNEYYKLVDQLDEALTEGVPSLIDCKELKVKGPVAFCSENQFRGSVEIINNSSDRKALPGGVYEGCHAL